MMNKIKELDKVYRKYEMAEEDVFDYSIEEIKPAEPVKAEKSSNTVPISEKEKKLPVSSEEKTKANKVVIE